VKWDHVQGRLVVLSSSIRLLRVVRADVPPISGYRPQDKCKKEEMHRRLSSKRVIEDEFNQVRNDKGKVISMVIVKLEQFDLVIMHNNHATIPCVDQRTILLLPVLVQQNNGYFTTCCLHNFPVLVQLMITPKQVEATIALGAN
jgi:hypothetical protein